MKRVLLTGASGFIGRHCLGPLLAGQFEVHALRRNPAPSLDATPAVVWHEADLLGHDLTLIDRLRPTHLLHLAWEATPPQFWTSPQNYRWAEATLRLARAFAEAGGKRMVVAGTCAEYDWRYGLCSEFLTPIAPTTPYGTCKAAVAQVLTSLCSQLGVSGAWARLFFVFGPHEHPVRFVPSIITSLLRQQPANCSHGLQVRDFLHVADVADALVTLLDSDVAGPVNIASGRPVELRTVAQSIGQQIGHPELIRLNAIAAASNDTPLLVADVRRLAEELRWSPKYTLEDGLAETIGWWRRQPEMEDP